MGALDMHKVITQNVLLWPISGKPLTQKSYRPEAYGLSLKVFTLLIASRPRSWRMKTSQFESKLWVRETFMTLDLESSHELSQNQSNYAS